MARIHGTIRIIPILVAMGCAPRAFERGEPATAEDLLPFGDENPHAVVRKALQRHARGAADVHHRFGYVFREGGFVQLYEYNAIDRGRPLVRRTYVDYAEIASVESSVVFDTARFRDRVELSLRGRFRLWESPVTPYHARPEVDEERRTREAGELVLAFDDAEAAHRLAEALRTLCR